MKQRKICVFSGKRGGFGALAPTMKAIERHPALCLSVVVADQHLYERFGRTVEEVEERFRLAGTIDMEQQGDSCRERARALGICLTKAADLFADLVPDVLLVIGDRGEVLAACIAAHNLRIAIAHVQGGDVSGSLDEPVRHAITKLAHIHFASTPRSAERILAMGEEPWRVTTTGDPHVDQLVTDRPTSPTELRARYHLPADEPFIVVLQHSDSTVPEKSREQMAETVAAVLATSLRTLFVYPCSDQGFEGIIAAIESVRGSSRVSIHPNIPAADFVGLQAIAGCLVGNSSAGLIEAPYFGLPAVNVGDRQVGRERTDNVIDVPPERDQILAALNRALFDNAFRTRLKSVEPPFGDGEAHKRIVDVLASIAIDDRLLNKRLAY